MNTRQKSIIFFIFGLVAGALLVVLSFWATSHLSPQGNIIFTMEDAQNSNVLYLAMVDGEGRGFQTMGTITGIAVFSPDGRWVASGSDDAQSIVIWDARNITDNSVYPRQRVDGDRMRPVEYKLPERCKPRADTAPKFLIHSMSWSPDGNSLAFICDGGSGFTNACILSLAGDIHCWDWNYEEFGTIETLDWSPKEDDLLISTGGNEQIYLVSVDGKNPRFVTNGVSPAWSPDGLQFAYFKRGGEPNTFGIAVENIDGTGLKWLYDPPMIDFQDINATWISPIHELMFSTITWSPDGNHIAFSAAYCAEYNYQIFRLDVRSREITLLTAMRSRYFLSPDWVMLSN